MNVTTSTFSITQMILAWTLLALLVGWMIIFAVLALRVFFKNAEWEDLPTPSRPHPAIYVQPADSRLQYIRVATGDVGPKSTHTESTRDIGTTSKK
jgi:tellurite resistance protein TehA-like permease